ATRPGAPPSRCSMQPTDCCRSGQRPETDQRATTGADRASEPVTFSAEAGETPAAGRLQAFFGGGMMTRRLALCLALVLASCASAEPGPAALREMFDIDVANWVEKGRVRYYLGFFTGLARERMAIWLQRLPRYEPVIRQQLVARGLPGDLAYLPLIESGYSP